MTETMQNYSEGDIKFLKRYRKHVIFYTVYDEFLINYIKDKGKTRGRFCCAN